MEHVDLLITHGTVLPMTSSDGSFLTDAAVAVKGRYIVDVGSTRTLTESYTASKRIDAGGCIVMPGFVDAHFHTAQQLLRGQIDAIWKTEGKAFPVWRNYLIPFERSLTEEDVYLGGIIAYLNMLSVGTTAFAEAGGPHCGAMIRAAVDSGIRGVFTTSTNLEILTEDDQVPGDITQCKDTIIAKNEELFSKWDGEADGRIRMWIAMNQITVSSEALVRAVADFASMHRCGVHIHLCEGVYEIQHTLEKWGKRPAEVFHDFGLFENPVLAAHAVLLSDEELQILAEHHVGVAHCVKGNFHLPGPPKVHLMLGQGMPVGVGSDGASGGAIGTLQRLIITRIAIDSHFASPYMHRGLLTDYDLVRMATCLGAEAIGLGGVSGTVEVGKEADIVIIDASSSEGFPCEDPYFLLVNSLTSNDVRSTIVAGQVLMENRRLKIGDFDEIETRCRKRMPFILERFSEFRRKRRCRADASARLRR